jgi:acetyl-CoA carboxylase biotin carboxyl carrier protein
MTFKEVQDLVKLISKSNLTEFKIKDGDFELSIRTNKHKKNQGGISAAAPATSQAPIIQMPPVQPTYQPATPTVQASAPAPQAEASKPKSEAAPAQKEDSGNYIEVKAPIVGTFYRSSSPEKPPYAKVGDSIEVGQTVCIIEAMKLFNEIESEVSGKVVKVMVEDAQPVEYDQVLFLVDPNG